MEVGAGSPARHVLVVDDDGITRKIYQRGLERAGFRVTAAESGIAALNAIEDDRPDIILSDVEMPGLNGFELVIRLRSDPNYATIPVIFITASASHSDDVVYGLSLGADDYLIKPVHMGELVDRINERLNSGAQPVGQLLRRPRGGVLNADAFTAEVSVAIAEATRSEQSGVLVAVEIGERDRLVEQFGRRVIDELVNEMSAIAASVLPDRSTIGRDRAGRLLMIVPAVDTAEALTEAELISPQLALRSFAVSGENLHITPAIGLAAFGAVAPDVSTPEALRRVRQAVGVAADTLDLRPVVWSDDLTAEKPERLAILPESSRTPFQFATTLVLGVIVPFLVYALSYALGFNLARVAYIVVVVALLITGVMIWIEGFLALRPIQPPDEPSSDPPPASAIIAAYLPNEAATVLDTLEAFLRVDYPNELQVILAYNTPSPLPIEVALEDLARHEPRLEVLKVEGSTSKAQNVNAAIREVRGEFVGIFDADHHPARDSFRRAWRWLSNGYDVVQGHCVVRNGDASWVAKTIAVEFEAIYAVSHPGRARLHGFGVFGGSNGYWRSSLLRETRMRGSMLTEDIDSSLRVVEAGHRIANDPLLLSRELGPTTIKALWNQRMRWAQGWFQVSLRHLTSGMRSSHLSARQKFGFLFLLGWREIYPWLSIQMIPIIAFLSLLAGGPQRLDWVLPVFVLTSIFTLSVGPGQALFAWLLAAPDFRRHKRWFWQYLAVASLLYTEFKNVINRVAQIKEATGERQWRVTPREGADAG